MSHNIFGFETLQHLARLIKEKKLDAKIELIVCRKTKERLCDQTLDFIEFAKKEKIGLVQTDNIKEDQVVMEKIEQIKPDFLFVFGWSQLIPENILKGVKELAIGSHPTLLPKYRGNAAIPWQILLGEKESGATLFEIRSDVGVDAGGILAQKRYLLDARETSTTLYKKFTENVKKILDESLKCIINGKIKPKPQQSPPSYLGKRRPSDSRINWELSSEEVDRLIRAQSFPYPVAYSYLKKGETYEKIGILDSELGKEQVIGVPGSILIGKGRAIVACGKGTIEIRNIRVENNSMDASKYLNGIGRFDIEMNDVLFEAVR
ncbi:MAG: methionyl-tRNA formyltransferase [Candidatus Micrarchaeota archaeon]